MLASYDVPAHVKQMAVFMLLYLTGKIHELHGGSRCSDIFDICRRCVWQVLVVRSSVQQHVSVPHLQGALI